MYASITRTALKLENNVKANIDVGKTTAQTVSNVRSARSSAATVLVPQTYAIFAAMVFVDSISKIHATTRHAHGRHVVIEILDAANSP